MQTVTVELCRRNSGNSRIAPAPSVIEWRTVSREEADRLLAERCPNGFFWRELPEDSTGNFPRTKE